MSQLIGENLTRQFEISTNFSTLEQVSIKIESTVLGGSIVSCFLQTYSIQVNNTRSERLNGSEIIAEVAERLASTFQMLEDTLKVSSDVSTRCLTSGVGIEGVLL